MSEGKAESLAAGASEGALPPILVFDLRKGIVGGLSFCKVVEQWFEPDEIFEIQNETPIAAEDWFNFTGEKKNKIRFIYGHNFTWWQRRVSLPRKCLIVGLLRHPLLKVSGISASTPADLVRLEDLSVQKEFSEYAAEGGLLPSDTVDRFLSGHFILGITELMEESLTLLHNKLQVTAPLADWTRRASRPDMGDNIFSSGLVSDLAKSPVFSAGAEAV